jgi:hypothetical protein
MNVSLPFWQLCLLALIPAIPSILAWSGSLKNKHAIQEVHLSVNSRMDQLLKITGAAKLAEGRKAEADDRATAKAVDQATAKKEG